MLQNAGGMAAQGLARPVEFDRRTVVAACLIYALFWAAAVSQWWIRDLVLPWDAKNQFYPLLRFLAHQIHMGEWPLWNPYHFAGHPTIADPQSMVFTPTLSFVALFSANPSMRAFDLAILGHLLVGGIGVILLFARARWHPAGGLLAALIYGLGGAASARLQHVGMIVTYGLFPIVWLLMEMALERRSWLLGIAFGACAALMALDRDQVAYMCCLTLLVLVARQTLRAPEPLVWLRSRLPVLVVMALTGALVLAVPVTLTLQFLADSNRPEFQYDLAASSSMHPMSLVTLLFPNVYGNLSWAYNYWGPGPHTIPGGPWNDAATSYLGIGTVPALLFLWHGVAARRLFAREFRFPLGLLVFGLLYSLGRYTPVFRVLFDHLPGVDLYRRPADAMFIINIGIAFVCGYLLHRQIRDGTPTLAEMLRGPAGVISTLAAALCVLLAVASAIYFGQHSRQLPAALLEMGIGAVLAGATVVLLVSARKPGWRMPAIAALVLLAGGELVYRNAGSALSGEPASRYAVFDTLPPDQQKGLEILRAAIAEEHRLGKRPRVEILGLGGAWQNASMVFNLEDTVGYNALRIVEYEKAVGSGENAVDLTLRTFPGTFRDYRSKLAALLGLEYLVLDRPIGKLPSHFPRLDARPLYEGASMWIYKVNDPAPRAYLATRVRPLDTEASLKEGSLPAFDIADEALVSDKDIGKLKGDFGQDGGSDTAAGGPPAEVRIDKYAGNTVTIDVDAPRAGVLVLHDPYYPGWIVTVNGERRPLLRANLLFRGVEVPAGKSRVVFRFEPLAIENLTTAAANLLSDAFRAP